MKLYRYRPLNDTLYKELLYSELYFATYKELNDPFDLTACFDFTPRDKNHLNGFLMFLFSKSVDRYFDSNFLKFDSGKIDELAHTINSKGFEGRFYGKLYSELRKEFNRSGFVEIDKLEIILFAVISELDVKFQLYDFRNELRRLICKFFESSAVLSFSEVYNNLLMWSHYASNHAGICLEFSVQESVNSTPFPYKLKRKVNTSGIPSNDGLGQEANYKEVVISAPVYKVEYVDKKSYINFFDFLPAFNDEDHPDLIGLTKSWSHDYAYILRSAFLQKQSFWKSEREWRAIDINFGSPKYSEERIRYYPISCLSAVYFGLKTPEHVKKRIFSIFEKISVHKINFFHATSALKYDLNFDIWEGNE